MDATNLRSARKVGFLMGLYGWFQVDLRTYFTKCNEMDRPWKIIIFLTHLFNARKASLTSRVPSFYSNFNSKRACIYIQTNVTQAYLAYLGVPV
jgi:hypothetical protein